MKTNPRLKLVTAALLVLATVDARSQLPRPGRQPNPLLNHGNRMLPMGPIRRHPNHQPGSVAQRPLPTKFGDPVGGLTAEQSADFQNGLEEFSNVETPESGLGPIFNNVSCVACHSQGGVGGAGIINVTRFGRMTNLVFDPLADLGGSLLQARAISPILQEVVPAQANVVAQRQTTPLFGMGLIEAIPDAEILHNVDPRGGDGIKGHASIITDVSTGQTRVGRFGWKAQQAVLLSFAGDAYLNEMGITNRFFPHENAPNGKTGLLAQFVDPNAPIEDQVDPDTGKSDIDTAADFMRLLAPPPVRPLSVAAAAGADIFQRIGCAKCHQPVMMTGTSNVAALDRKPVALYSDLLLHDMGALGDGIAQADAGPREMRTAPLWGLRVSAPYLHDGRASSVDAAIRLHDGEAANPRNRYLLLAPVQRAQLLEFLNSI